MFKEIGYILLSFFIAYLAFEGLLLLLEKDYGIKFSIGEEIFFSEDGGKDWIAMRLPTREWSSLEKIAFDENNPHLLYIATEEGLLHASNEEDGRFRFMAKISNFKAEKKPIFVSELVFSPHDFDTLYFVSKELTKDKIFVSHNKGKDFRPIFISQDGDRVSAFAPDPFFFHILYVGTEKGMFLKSEDFGTSWQKKEEFSQRIGEIVLNPHKKGEIYILLSREEPDPFDYWSKRKPAKIMVSEDTGESFKDFVKKFSLPDKEGDFKQIVFDPILDKAYLVCDFSLLAQKGKRFEVLEGLSPSKEARVNTFTIDPQNSNILYLGVGEVIYKSEDSGKNWQIIESPTVGFVKKIQIHPRDSDIILVAVEKTL